MDSILENLNETQRKIVTDTEGAVLVLAGAGSGKTRVLTHRVAYIVKELGVPGWNILAITFTNKATAEMRERLEILLGPDNGVWVSTFHSFSASMLRKFADKIGFKNNFSIYDETDSKRVIAKAMRELHIDNQQLKDVIKEHISRAKNAGMDPDEYFNEINGLTDFAYDIKRVYERYNELLTASNAMDFDDLLHRMKEVLTVSEEALQYCRRRFRYIHVDEFQDTNKVQYEIVKLIAGEHGNIFVVGDDDQSIYGWRGAEIKNILNFDKEFPDAKVYKLVENYRSTPEILEAANKLIHYNTERHEKSLVPIRKDGAEVTYFTAYNDLQEADWVIDKIRFLMARYGYRKSDFAILVRATSLTRLFESALAKIGMKYRVLGGIRFYDRKEILDTLAYMRLISNNADNEALERIINVPQRGIGEASVQKIRDFASERGLSMFDAVLSPELPEQLKKKVQPFAALIGDLLSNSFIKLGDFVEYLIEKVGFERYYTSTGSEEEAARWDNVKEFLSEVKQFEEKLPDATLNDFLQTVTLVRDDEDDDPDRDKITVATMHAVKGLEFAVVFTVGLEEGTFPSAQALKADEKSMEEERRVMYVAITRARDRLFITNAGRRFKFNHTEPCLPSRFVDESRGVKNDSYMTMKMRTDYISGFSAKPSFLSDRRSPKPVIPAKPAKPAVQKDLTGFVKGAEVTHPRYGDGIILSVSGSGKDATASISFKDLGIKKFVLQLAPLTLKK